MVTNNSTNTATGASGTILRGAGIGSAPTFSTASYPSTASTSGNVLTSDGTNWISSAPAGGSGAVKLAIQSFTSTGAYTYTPTAHMLFCVIEFVGAGGGSGGCTSTTAQISASGGGAGGSYLKIYATSAQIGASATGSVGTGGTAGTAGNNPGGGGGDTTCVIGGSTWTAAGGGAGTGSASQSTIVNVAGGASNANTTGSNATLILNIAGQAGGPGRAGGGAYYCAMSGAGGNSILGLGGIQINAQNDAASYVGLVGTGYGAGASDNIGKRKR